MSDQTETPEPEAATEAAQPEQQDSTDWKAEARKWEARAKSNRIEADQLKELEGKAERVDQLESEKAEAVAEATERAEKAESEAMRLKVILDYGIPEKLRPLVDGDSEEALTAKAKALSEELASKQSEAAVNTSEAPRMPLEGKSPNSFALNSDQVEGALKSALGISN